MFLSCTKLNIRNLSSTLQYMKALILVDLQNDFCKGGALEVKGGDEVIPIANHLMPKFDKGFDWKKQQLNLKTLGIDAYIETNYPESHDNFNLNELGKIRWIFQFSSYFVPTTFRKIKNQLITRKVVERNRKGFFEIKIDRNEISNRINK